MPRSDYERMQRLTKKNNGKISYELFFHLIELNNLNYPFTKIYDYNTITIDDRYSDKFDKNLWIDIFPVGGHIK